MQIQIPITHTQVFGDNKIDINSCITGISRSTLVNIALSLIYKREFQNDTRNFCENFFCKENSDFASFIWDRYIEISRPNSVEDTITKPFYIFVSEHTGLELLSIIFSLPVYEKNTISNAEMEQRLFHSFVAINESINTDPTPEKDDDIHEELKTPYLLLTNTLPKDFINRNIYKKMVSQIEKAQALSDFCSTNRSYKTLLNSFLTSHCCKSIEEYVYCLMKLFIICDKTPNNATYIQLDPNDKNYLRDKNILSSISIDINETIQLKENTDYKEFRNRPIIKTGENEFVVISQSFCLDRIYSSIIFSFKSLNAQLPKNEKIADVFADYTTRFSEEFLFYNVMNRIFEHKNCIKLSGQDCKRINSKCVAEPDFYVRSFNNIMLFEFKDPLFNANTKVSEDFHMIKNYIEDKLVHKIKTDKGSAIEQLANNIHRILSNDFVWDLNINSRKSAIYPVLVVGNHLFTYPGIQSLLNHYFQIELSKLSEDCSRVKDLVVVDIDTLLLFRESYNDKTLEFLGTIKQYFHFLRNETPYKNTSQMIFRNAFHANFSFSVFLEENYRANTLNIVDRFMQDCMNAGIS